MTTRAPHVSDEEDPNPAYTLFGLVGGKIKDLVADKAGYISVPHADTFTIGASGSVRLAEEKSVTRAEKCFFAACPFVLVGSESRGEILRNLRRSELGGTQAVNIGALAAGRHTITIKELKPETTYLDAVWVAVGGQQILPTSCDRGERPDHCDADGRRARIVEGAELALEFELSVGGQAATRWRSCRIESTIYPPLSAACTTPSRTWYASRCKPCPTCKTRNYDRITRQSQPASRWRRRIFW